MPARPSPAGTTRWTSSRPASSRRSASDWNSSARRCERPAVSTTMRSRSARSRQATASEGASGARTTSSPSSAASPIGRVVGTRPREDERHPLAGARGAGGQLAGGTRLPDAGRADEGDRPTGRGRIEVAREREPARDPPRSGGHARRLPVRGTAARAAGSRRAGRRRSRARHRRRSVRRGRRRGGRPPARPRSRVSRRGPPVRAARAAARSSRRRRGRRGRLRTGGLGVHRRHHLDVDDHDDHVGRDDREADVRHQPRRELDRRAGARAQ